MIAWLTGRLVEKAPTRVILDVHGVGYDVAVPVSTFYAVGDPGAEVTLRIHTHVREDALALFGFLTTFELAVFERLIAHQRHRAEAGTGRAVGHRGRRPRRRRCSAATSPGSRAFPASARRPPSASASS